MATLKLIQFSGEVPRVLPRLLPDMGAQLAENVRLENGGLLPIRRARAVHTIVGLDEGAVETIYKHGDEWLAWETVVNAAPGPVAQDRLYYTGDGVPKMRVDGDVYELAVPFPTGALTATPSGTGTGDIITRVYAYTYVTDFGEESEPCPISNEIDWQDGITVTLSGFATAPIGRNITKQRIYRLQSSVAAGTDLFLIAERTDTASNYVDTVGVDDFSEPLPSKDWNAPPDELEGLTALTNGMMAAFVGKDLYFCEPWQPHAWPEKYILTMDYPIVALGAYGTTLVVMTEGNPYIVDGSAPEFMQQLKLELNLPCINARGVVDLGYAVAYPSYDGLVLVAGGQANVVTMPLLARNDWLKTSPTSFVAGQYSGRYFASFEYVDDLDVAHRGTFILDVSGATPFLMRGARYADACFYSITESALYMLDGLTIYEWDALGETYEIMSWSSKEFILPMPVSYGAIMIDSDSRLSAEEEAAQEAEAAAIAASNAALFALASIGGEINGAAYNVYPVNGDSLQRVDPDTFTSVKVYADEELIATITETDRVKRLPAVKARKWEVQVNGTRPLAQIAMATTVQELNSI